MEKDPYKLSRRSSRHQKEEEDEEKAAQLAKRRKMLMYGAPAGVAVLVVLIALLFSGKRSGGPTVFPEDKLRLDRLFGVEKAYCEKNGSGPPNEQAFRDFFQKMPQPDKDALKLPASVDEVLQSPRDGSKYELKWGVVAGPNAESTKLIAWEKTLDSSGQRWVLFANGDTEHFVEYEFQKIKK
jgi:hypothetical protein